MVVFCCWKLLCVGCCWKFWNNLPQSRHLFKKFRCTIVIWQWLLCKRVFKCAGNFWLKGCSQMTSPSGGGRWGFIKMWFLVTGREVGVQKGPKWGDVISEQPLIIEGHNITSTKWALDRPLVTFNLWASVFKH